MSCHNIGRGMNSVVNVVIKLYDKGKISREAARVIIAQCQDGVGWCDGNGYEAIECIADCRCGRCLRLVPEGELLLNIWEVPPDFRLNRKVFDKNAYATNRFCESCFAAVVTACYDDVDQDTILEWRDYIMKKYSKSNYLSTGKMEPV